MVNHITNDKGEDVIAVGAPGSFERIKAEHPKLIERLNYIYWSARADGSPGRRIDEAIKEIREAGIEDGRTTNLLLLASDYSLDKERDGLSVFDLVIAVG